jgi:flagellar basal-body rod modification protein FlgD
MTTTSPTTGTSSNVNPAATTQKTSGNNATDASAASKSLDENYNQFLRLLTTQMQNQDPLNPMDTNQMTSQLVQFSAVEQAIGTNKRLDTLIGTQQNTATAGNLMYIGRGVEYAGDTFQYINGMSAIELGYQLDSEAQSTRIDILNSKNEVVYTTSGQTKPDTKHSFVWDFKDTGGNAVPIDTYRLNIAPTPKANEDYVKTKVYTRGLVTNVDNTESGKPVVHVNGTTVPISDIISVS